MKNLILSISSGLLLALSWPTYGFSPLLFIGFVPLLLAIENIHNSDAKKKGRKVFFHAYLSFLIWNFISTWWVHYADLYAGIFAITANSLLFTILIRLYYFIRTRSGLHLGKMFLVTLWISFEKFHMFWDLSWPWLNLGNGFAESYKWVQWYEYTGAFGGTLWVWIVNLSIFSIVQNYSNKRKLIFGSLRVLAIVIIPILYSLNIYSNYEEKGEETEIVVLQPNLDPYSEKFRFSDETLSQQLIELANEKTNENTSFVFGPETSLPGAADRNTFYTTDAANNIYEFLNQHKGTHFVTGATLVSKYYTEEEASEFSNSYKGKFWYDISNSALHFNINDSLKIYDKSKLVVGVEHMPFRNVIKPLLGDFVLNLGGTIGTHVTQDYRTVFENDKFGVKIGPIICYESIYGEFVTDYVNNGANILAVITNDGWWKESQGHKQHLSFSRLRAIENRRSVARSANTGISAFINQRGDILKSLKYDTKGSLSASINVNNELTIYTQHGDYIARISIFLFVLLLTYGIANNINRRYI